MILKEFECGLFDGPFLFSHSFSYFTVMISSVLDFLVLFPTDRRWNDDPKATTKATHSGSSGYLTKGTFVSCYFWLLVLIYANVTAILYIGSQNMSSTLASSKDRPCPGDNLR